MILQRLHYELLSAQCINDYIPSTGVVDDLAVIFLQKIHLVSLSHIQLPLRENVFQTLVISVNFKRLTKQVMTPYLQTKDDNRQLQVVSRVVPLIRFQLSAFISDHSIMLHQNASQTHEIHRSRFEIFQYCQGGSTSEQR